MLPNTSFCSRTFFFSHYWLLLISPLSLLYSDGSVCILGSPYVKLFRFLKYLIEIYLALVLYLSCLSSIEVRHTILIFYLLSMSQDSSAVDLGKRCWGSYKLWIRPMQQRWTGSRKKGLHFFVNRKVYLDDWKKIFFILKEVTLRHIL